MEKVTLNNRGDWEAINKNLPRPESIDDILSYRDLKSSLEDNGHPFKEVTDFNTISFGHFIVMEKILGFNIDTEKKTRMLLPYILRPINEDKLDNSNKELEDKHIQEVLNYSIGSTLAAFTRFLEIRNTYLYKTYNGVIYGTLYDDDDDDDEEDKETHIDSSQSAREFHTKKFFWNELILVVAGGSIFETDRAVELPMFVVMPFLAQKRSLQIVENLEQKARSI